MSREYEGNPVAKCMNARKGDCFGINCPCEDYRPTYLMSKEDAETIMPRVRDRSINPGAIRYRNKHTRIAGEHRYPREDIIVDTYGNKRIGGYDDNIGKADPSDKPAEIQNLYNKYPKIRLICGVCGAKKLFNIENIGHREKFVYACPQCHNRNGIEVSAFINKIKNQNKNLDDYFTYKCTDLPVDDSSSFKELAVDYLLKEAFKIPDDPYRDLNLAEDIVIDIYKLEQNCAFMVNKYDFCVFDGKPRKKRCGRKCKNFTNISFISPQEEELLSKEIWPVYQNHLKDLRLRSETIERQIKVLNKQLAAEIDIDEDGKDLASMKQTLKQELNLLIKQRNKIKAKWNRLIDAHRTVKTTIQGH